jgi:3-hydroxyisobutyrate dehydrogenase-like beta-hydroxyacid dehydrogenase
MKQVHIIGAGVMGAAYAARLRIVGYDVLLHEPDGAATIFGPTPTVLLSLFTGADAAMVIAQLPSGSCVLDLTTQGLDECQLCCSTAERQSIDYYAGGVTGGAQQARDGTLALLIGPDPPKEVRQICAGLGRLRCFPSAAAAVAGKLLHNLVLVVTNHILGAAMQLSKRANVEDLPAILDEGTTGRPPSKSSLVRDCRGHGRSSYTGRLVSKDIDALLRSFPLLRELVGIDLSCLARHYGKAMNAPFSLAALQFTFASDEPGDLHGQ